MSRPTASDALNARWKGRAAVDALAVTPAPQDAPDAAETPAISIPEQVPAQPVETDHE